MTKETADFLVATGTVLSALATTVAVLMSWKVYEGQRLLSQRQLLIPLWEYMTAVRNLNSAAPATPEVLRAANTLELIALSVEGRMVDPAVIRRTFADVYLSIYRQITEIKGLPKMTNAMGELLSGAELLDNYPAASKFYEQLRKEKLDRGSLGKG